MAIAGPVAGELDPPEPFDDALTDRRGGAPSQNPATTIAAIEDRHVNPEPAAPDRNAAASALLESIRRRLPEIDELLATLVSMEEDSVYRYYHQSFKVYRLQTAIEQAQALFEGLAPEGIQLNGRFTSICRAALQQKSSFDRAKFDWERMNRQWHAETLPILQAFWHCMYFLRQLARYGRELDEPPQLLPSGWAALLYLYEIR